MNFKDIKTVDQFYEIGDIWYQRTIRLCHIWQDLNEPYERRSKALFLWKIMFERMQKIFQFVVKISQPKRNKNIENNGLSIVGETNEEIILTHNNKTIKIPKA